MHHPRKFWKVANDTSLVVYRETIIRGSLLYVRLGGGHTSLCETTGHQSLLPHAEVWNQWSDFRIYIYIYLYLWWEIFHVEVVKFAKARSMLMNVDNSYHVLLLTRQWPMAEANKIHLSTTLKATTSLRRGDINKLNDLVEE